MATQITDVHTQIYEPNTDPNQSVPQKDHPDYQQFVEGFENEKIQTISTQLYYVFNGRHDDIKVGDRDSLRIIIDQMVEHRLDNPKLVPYVPSFSPIKGINTPPRIYRFFGLCSCQNNEMFGNYYKKAWQEQCKLDKINKMKRKQSSPFIEHNKYYREYLKELVERRWDDIEFITAVFIVESHKNKYGSKISYTTFATLIRKTPHEEILKIAVGETGKRSTHVNPL